MNYLIALLAVSLLGHAVHAASILNLRRRVRKLEAGPGAARKLRDVVAGPDVRERAPENSVLRFRVAA